MDADDCNGRFYTSASGDSSLEFSVAVGGPTVSTPNSKDTSPNRSLSANSIKVELYSDEDPGRSTEDERGERLEEGNPEQGSGTVGGYSDPTNPDIMPTETTRMPNGKLKCDICGMICIGPNVLMVHKRSHTGERPFQCNQCGASFTQKGNLLRHIKLHSGEKPFKCPFCCYACRRRDALTGHLRTHAVSSPTVGKPYKCSYCGRSYKQQSTLGEHRERCHSYLESLQSQQPSGAQNAGEEMRELEFIPESGLPPSPDKMIFIDRLANSITKRKRSMPQRFVGQKHMRFNLEDAPSELGTGLDKDREMHPGERQAPPFTGVAGRGGGPTHLATTHPSLSELRPVHGSIHNPPGTGTGLGAVGVGGREAAGHEDLPLGPSHAASPNGCQDSTDTESMPDEPCHSDNGHHLLHCSSYQPAAPSIGHHRSHGKDGEDGGQLALQPPVHAPVPGSPSSLRVVDGEGRAVRSFRCEHCRVLFLDHVMFTIHMGCHGFRQPFECNICGHRSRDRYEFSSHIVRGEHIID
ncbi:zinc finger protein Eos-like [Brachionichthys hirsutus]|uniref:zinc finger protein Eos-like n=1 Tax=Brachionichthys hirsutus TaxID=412623 RepID=UPI0036050BBA